MFKMIKQEKVYSPSEIEQLVIELRIGKSFPITELIKAHITLANKIAGWYTGHYVFRKDDLYAVSFEGLVEGVHRAQTTLTDNDITPFLARTIKGHIQHFLEKDSLIPIPEKKFKARVELEDPMAYSLRTQDTGGHDINYRDIHESGITESIAFILPLTDHMQENLDIPVYDYTTQRMEDLYVQMRLTPFEIEIVDARLDGKTLHEIGNQCGVSHEQVRLKIEGIKLKIRRLNLKTVFRTSLITGKKECSRCHAELSLSFFYKISEGSYKSQCKKCLKEIKDEKAIGIY